MKLTKKAFGQNRRLLCLKNEVYSAFCYYCNFRCSFVRAVATMNFYFVFRCEFRWIIEPNHLGFTADFDFLVFLSFFDSECF